MFKKKGIYIIIALAALGLLMLLQYSKPKEINWFPSFVAQHKIPYGTFVLNGLMKTLFSETVQVTATPYQFLTDNPDAEGTYFFVNGEIKFEETELNVLLDWTSAGNTLFIASGGFERVLLDTLGLETGNLYKEFGEREGQLYQLVHPQLQKNKGYPFKKDPYVPYFEKIDTLKTTVIGLVDHLTEEGTIVEEHFNAVQRAFGEGKIVLTTFPKAFTNYFILKDDNREYTAGLLSYVDGGRTIYMDNHYKSGKSFYTSPMYIFLNNKALKWAYYLALIGTLIYVVFEGKRKQRAIPIVKPLQNQTLAFTRTIADMYFEKGDQKQIAEHKITYFLEYVRSHFYLGTLDRNKDFNKNLASRSRHSEEEIETLFAFFEQLGKQQAITDQELQQLNTSIENFKKRAHGRE